MGESKLVLRVFGVKKSAFNREFLVGLGKYTLYPVDVPNENVSFGRKSKNPVLQSLLPFLREEKGGRG